MLKCTLKVFSLPADIREETAPFKDLLKGLETEVLCTLGTCDVGISLGADLSDYCIGDLIWIEAELVGEEAGEIGTGLMHHLASKIANRFSSFIALKVNNEERVNQPNRWPCTGGFAQVNNQWRFDPPQVVDFEL